MQWETKKRILRNCIQNRNVDSSDLNSKSLIADKERQIFFFDIKPPLNSVFEDYSDEIFKFFWQKIAQNTFSGTDDENE